MNDRAFQGVFTYLHAPTPSSPSGAGHVNSPSTASTTSSLQRLGPTPPHPALPPTPPVEQRDLPASLPEEVESTQPIAAGPLGCTYAVAQKHYGQTDTRRQTDKALITLEFWPSQIRWNHLKFFL